jgi:hypothetical protein
MEAEPPKADLPKRKRRWLQFSLRTLMIAVALLAVPLGYVGWQAKIVRERNAYLRNHGWKEGDWSRLSALRRWLGDFPAEIVWIPTTANVSERKLVVSLFPEARVETPIETIKRDLGEDFNHPAE